MSAVEGFDCFENVFEPFGSLNKAYRVWGLISAFRPRSLMWPSKVSVDKCGPL